MDLDPVPAPDPDLTPEPDPDTTPDPDPDTTLDPTSFFIDFKDGIFLNIFFLITCPQAHHVQS
jgi:hypothetical protein